MEQRVRIVVDDRVRVDARELRDEVVERICASFTHSNPQAGKKAGEPERYETWRFEDGDGYGPVQGEMFVDDGRGRWLTVPRGGMKRVRDELRAGGYSWAVEDARVWKHPAPDFPDHLRTLRPYQVRLRDAAVKRENCLLHGATGCGKTTAFYGILAHWKRYSLVMVWTEGLLKQWRERAVEELGMHEDDVGLVQGKSEYIRPLTLAMQQTVAARFRDGDYELASKFDIVGCDEVQRMAAETCYAAVDPFRARVRLGFSADHTRKDRKDFLIRDLFGEVAEEIREEETIAAGATVDVEIYVVPTKFAAPWYRYRQDFNRLLAQMVDDEERNELALRIAKSVVDQGEQVLLFSHRVEHARKIDAALVGRGVQCGVMVGGGKQDSLAFDRTKDGLKNGSLRAAAGTYQAIAQGIDLPTVARGVCMTPIANNRQNVGQVRGRICRPADGKDFGRLYYLWDKAVYGKRPIANFVKWFRTVRVWDGSATAWIEGTAWLRRSSAA